MRSRAFTIVELLVVALTMVLVAAILYPVFYGGTRCDERGASCRSNLKQIGLGIRQYRADFDERLPPARLAAVPGRNSAPAYGWVDALQPYLQSFQIFQCPSEPNAPAKPAAQRPRVSALDGQLTDYWMNRGLLGANASRPRFPAQRILLGEGNDGSERCDARYTLPALPRAWRTTVPSPALRHQGGANYAFVDGHAKWLKPDLVSDDPVSASTFSFFPEAGS